MKYLIILNDAPYGSERTYNGLRLAISLTKREQTSIAVFLMGDAVACSLPGQTTPNGYYNIERMLKALSSKGAQIGICGSCMDARGIDAATDGTQRSSMDELTAWATEADKVLVF